jgi:hypothetical protein
MAIKYLIKKKIYLTSHLHIALIHRSVKLNEGHATFSWFWGFVLRPLINWFLFELKFSIFNSKN